MEAQDKDPLDLLDKRVQLETEEVLDPQVHRDHLVRVDQMVIQDLLVSQVQQDL